MKTVIITGANGNLGTAVTREFLDKGYTVIATVVNESAKADMPAHANLDVQVVNLTDESETTSFIEAAVKKYGTIDAALLLVGGFAMGNIITTGSTEIKKQVSLNFETAYHVARPLFQHMQATGYGRLVFIGARPSLLAEQGKSLLAYGLSKSLLFKLAEYLNEEARGKNITTTVVVPSTLDTPLNRKNQPGTDPANWVTPQQLAAVLEFICSGNGEPLRELVVKVYNNS